MQKNHLRKYKGYTLFEVPDNKHPEECSVIAENENCEEVAKYFFDQRNPVALNFAIEQVKASIDVLLKTADSNADSNADATDVTDFPMEEVSAESNDSASDPGVTTDEKESGTPEFAPDVPFLVKERRGYAIVNEGLTVEHKDAQRRIAVRLMPWEFPSHPAMVFTYPRKAKKKEVDEAISKAEQWIDQLRRCKVCGCTEHDCRQCIVKTGAPCTWVEKDLCSACQETPSIVVNDTRAAAEDAVRAEEGTPEETADTVPPVVMPTTFFSQLATTGKVDMTMRIYQHNDRFIAEFYPGPMTRGDEKPVKIEGTPQEFDEGFFPVIMTQLKVIRPAKGLQSNIDEVKASNEKVDEPVAEKKIVAKPKRKPVQRKTVAKKPAPKQSPVKKAVAKKTAPAPKAKPEKKIKPAKLVKKAVEKKVAKPKPVKVEAPAPTVESQSLF